MDLRTALSGDVVSTVDCSVDRRMGGPSQEKRFYSGIRIEYTVPTHSVITHITIYIVTSRYGGNSLYCMCRTQLHPLTFAVLQFKTYGLR